MKKLILTGLLSVGVACACDTKECKKFIAEFQHFKKSIEIASQHADNICDIYTDITLRQLTSIIGEKDAEKVYEVCSKTGSRTNLSQLVVEFYYYKPDDTEDTEKYEY